jgi:hypothetical protein
VIQVEDTEVVTPADSKAAAGGQQQQKRIRVDKAAKPGQDIRPVGSDIQ